jgi:hypothetical protein
MKKAFIVLMATSALFLSGCASTEQAAKIADLEQKLTEMQQKLDQQQLETYSSEKYSFKYPSGYSITEPDQSFPALTVKKADNKRMEIFQLKDFPRNDRPLGFSGEETEEEVDGYAYKESLTVGPSDNPYNVWLFYSQDDTQTQKELKAILGSIVVKPTKAAKPGETPISVTEPKADSTPTSFIKILSPKADAILREEPFNVTGETSTDCDKIVANSKNEEFNLNDTYTLQTYKRGNSTFKLGVKHEWKNLDVGKNVYTFTATCDGGVKTASVAIFFEASGGAEMGKPVIYLYPTKEQKTFVLPKPENGITVSEPALGNGWNVTAYPDGKIVDADGKVWPYLFWEGFSDLSTPKEGFMVQKSGLSAFFDKKLSYLGLNAKEIADFKDFWMAKLNEDKFYFISFVSQAELDKHAPLVVEPKPDTAIRVFFDYSTSDKPFAFTEQKLEKGADRNGFTLVEWGGELH